MKYIIIILASTWLMSCSEEFAAPMPPTIISGTANNQSLNQNPVVNLSNGDSLIVQLTMLVPNGLSDVRIEAIGLNEFGSISRIDITENATLTNSPGDSIFSDFTIRKVVNDLESLPRAIGSTSQINFAVIMIDSEYLTARVDFKVERQ